MREPLPIDEYLPIVKQHLKNSSSLIVTAEPGAGKTTRLPVGLMEDISGKILVLEPRRVAAIAAATRIASENNFTLGKEVGYQVRFDNKTSPETQLIFMTEALLIRYLLQNPNLEGVGAIVLDEFHERSLHVDLALGCIKELQDLGSSIRLIIMSATLHVESLASYLGNVPWIAVPGKLYPLEIRYQKYSLPPILDESFFKTVADAVREVYLQTDKDILVFLPGVGEIFKLQEQLSNWSASNNISIQILHGSLDLKDQREVLRSHSQPRIILSTNIAESSVTIDGVGVVVDTGLSKVMRFDHRTGFGRLSLGRISLASATQRAGRSARQFSGVCLRLWSRSDEASMLPNEVPEIQRANLSEALLFLAATGVTDFAKFSWFERPHAKALQSAIQELQDLEALDVDQRLTALGKKLIQYPLSPPLAKLYVLAQQKGLEPLAADLVALLQEKDFVRDSTEYRNENFECDIIFRLMLLQEFRKGARSLPVDRFQIQNILKVSAQYSKSQDVRHFRPEDVRFLILNSYLNHLCRRRGKTERGLSSGGRGVKIERESCVQKSEFFVALSGRDAANSTETLIDRACGMDKEFILNVLKDKIRIQEDLYYDDEKNKFFMRRYKVIQDLPLDEPSLESAKPEFIQDHMADVLVKKWDWLLNKNKNLNHWWSRWNYFNLSYKAELSVEVLKVALQMAALNENNLEAVAAKDLIYFLEMQIDPQILQDFQAQVPAKLMMPTGSWIPIQYPEGRDPFLEVRIQEVFGMKETPKILGGKIPIVLHLLAPNYRPQQITKDLQSFWKNGYPEVRKELRLRYPKHSWPEDPHTAPPVAKGRSQKK